MVNRESNIVSQYQLINEWFEYAHQGIEAVGLRDFPRFKEDNMEYGSVFTKKTKIHDKIKSDDIFHLPRLQISYNSTIINSKLLHIYIETFFMGT